MPVTPVGGTEASVAGQAALQSADWAEARARFEEAVSAGGTPEAWEGLSRAAWWQGDQARTFAARERSYRAYRDAHDACGAARMAMWLASDHLDFLGDDAVASAWLRRARALLEGHQPCSELGYALLLEADIALLARSAPAAAAALAREAMQLARTIGDVGVEVVSVAILGSSLVVSGAVEEGLRWLEEGVGLAIGEEFAEAAAPGWALCHTVSACAEVGDFARAEQWCRALHTWSAGWRARHFFGVCRTAYGEVLATRGDWPTAEQELLSALEDLRSTRPALAATTAVRLGRLRIRQGDLVEGRRLLETAVPLPQAILALAELDLGSGDPASAAAAADAADRVLRRSGEGSVLDRFPALELLAWALALAGNKEQAEQTTSRLELEAARIDTPYMRGRVRLTYARVRSAAGDHDGARRAGEDAVDLFVGCAAPYEAAVARELLASSLRLLGRVERADSEARAAQEALALLGARPPHPGRGDGQLSPRETDILRLVAHGMGDAAIAERLFLSPHTVHRHIANIRTKLGVPSRAAAVAHASRHGLL